MKREIKFRGKCLYNGQWHHGDLAHDAQGNPMIQFLVCEPVHVDPSTVGQCTGIEDYNGMETYEGDIISYKPYNYDKSYRFMVEYRIPRFLLINQSGEEFGFEASLLHGTIRVIGNIHDNPEMLKGGEK